jgi:hypothetical protein
MINVTPCQFQDAFSKVLEQLRDELATHWTATADYTRFMRGQFLPRVAKELGLEAHCADYYTLDAVFYAEKDTKYFSPHKTYAKYLVVAIEHEDKAQTSCVEMNKLQLINASLKVLITYAKPGSEVDGLLLRYSEIVRGADCFGDTASLRRQLVIFGEPGGPTNWHFFAYEREGFVRLPAA